MRARSLLPPLGWTLVIACFSASRWGALQTGSYIIPALRWAWPSAAPEQLETLHWFVRKSAHVTEYGVLAALWSRALGEGDARRRWWGSLALAVLTAALDELHQATTVTRSGTVRDVLLDTSAAAAVLLVLKSGARTAARWLTGVLLWLAAAGGTALIALDWAAGVPAGWLWWSVPASWVALALRRVERRFRV